MRKRGTKETPCATHKEPRLLKPSEHQEQVALIQWCDLNQISIFAIPNGGSRDKITGAMLKREGVRSGVPDLFIPIPKGFFHGMFIEMKVGSNKPSDNQKKWIALLQMKGYHVVVSYSFDEAMREIMAYLAL